MRGSCLPVLLLLLAAPAAGQVEAGEAAPEFPEATWFGDPPATKLADLRGRVVVLWFFSTADFDQSSELAVLRRGWSRFRRDGLVILCFSRDAPAEVERWMQEKDIPWPVAADCSAAEAFDAPSSFLYVLDFEGKVLWYGFPWDSGWHAQLPSALRLAARSRDRWDPGERIPELAEAVEHCRYQRFGKAWKAAGQVLRRVQKDAGKKAAVEQFLADLTAEGVRRLDLADADAAAGRYQVATDFLEHHLAFFKGSEAGDAMEARLKEWRRDRLARKLRKLDQARLEALEVIYREGNPGKGRKQLRELLEKAAGTPLAETIRADLADAGG